MAAGIDRRPQIADYFPRNFGELGPNFPEKFGVEGSGLGETLDLLRSGAARSVRETFTEGSGTTVYQKARATGKGHPKE
jgi:hypothetical protein